MKRIRAICAYCGIKWDDYLNVPEKYQHGMSICNDCVKNRHLENMFNEKTILINPVADPHEFQLWSDLTRRDADKLRGCPCNWCTRPSTARIRRYNLDGDLRKVNVIAACDKHLKKLKRITVVLQ